jgi:hypothetical protein|tara:strand:- start:97 stop:336 length:240 start_codon:yes stop_codon:yes gene_type:complete
MTKNNYLKLSKSQILDQIKLMADQTDRLLLSQKRIMQLEQAIFHEKWKFRYVARLLKQYAPHEAVSEEELDEQIKAKQN